MSESNDTHAHEIWKPVAGFDGRYEVSNFGRVKSVAGTFWGRTYREKILKPGIVRGYPQVVLCNGKPPTIQKKVHQLVLEAFVGPCPEGMECRHLNGDRGNPSLDNLMWGTKKENGEDRVRHGTTLTGERHHKAKVTREQVEEMRRLRAGGMMLKDLVAKFGIGFSQVSFICRGHNWK